ncbi:MAG: hypothetical protein AB1Z20_01830 [Desulfobacterales bacterium]
MPDTANIAEQSYDTSIGFKIEVLDCAIGRRRITIHEFWSLGIVCYLLFAIWNFSTKRKRFLFDQTGCLRPEAALNLEPETLSAFDCVAQGTRDTS